METMPKQLRDLTAATLIFYCCDSSIGISRSNNLRAAWGPGPRGRTAISAFAGLRARPWRAQTTKTLSITPLRIRRNSSGSWAATEGAVADQRDGCRNLAVIVRNREKLGVDIWCPTKSSAIHLCFYISLDARKGNVE
eukprot:9488910-Pyramimonas_sp.AAC.1